VLKGFAKRLVSSSRDGSDWMVRYGGEEFLIVLPESSLTDAMSFAEKMRMTIVAKPFDVAGQALQVSASFGVATFDPAGTRAGWTSTD